MGTHIVIAGGGFGGLYAARRPSAELGALGHPLPLSDKAPVGE